MTGYIGDYRNPAGEIIILSVLAGFISGIIPFIGAIHWTYILAFLGTVIFSALLVYRYDWIQILAVFLMSVALIEPAPCDILFIFLLALGLIEKHINMEWVKNHRLIFFAFMVFGLINTLQIFYVLDMGAGIRYYLITMYLIVFCLFTASYAIEKGTKNVLRAYILATTLSAVIGISGYFGLFPSILLYDRYRIMALFKDPNVLGPFMVPTILIMAGDIAKKDLIVGRGYIHGFIITINILGVIATFSRGAWVNLGVSLIACLLINIPRLKLKGINRKKILIWGISAILFMTIIWFFAIGEEYREFFYSRISLQSYDKGRFATQARGVMLGLFNFLGYGPGQFEYRLTEESGILFSAHNLYIRLLVENGIPGFVAFMGTLALIYRDLLRGLRTPHRLSGISGGILISILFGIMVNSIVIDTLHWRHLWFFIGLSIANIVKGVGEDNEYKGSEYLEGDGAL